MPRLTDAQRASRKQEDLKMQRYLKQEAKRAEQVQIDQKGTLWLLGGLGIVTFLTTAVLTADGTIGSAATARFAYPWMGFLLFGAIEVAILAFMLLYYVRGSRVDIETGKPQPALQWFVASVFASAIAVAASVYHVAELYEFDLSDPDLWVGAALRTVIAVFFVLISKGLASVIFAKALRRGAARG